MTNRHQDERRSHRSLRLRSALRILRAAVVLPVAAALLLANPVDAKADSAGSADTKSPFTAAQSETQAALVLAEDHRLDQVRAVTAIAPLKGARWRVPYRLPTGDGYTMVLTPRRMPYTIADLLQLEPQTFIRRSDGSYLLTENLYLVSGAKLDLSNPGGLTLRLASESQGFVSIVSFGGQLNLEGTAQAPVRITSWDPTKNRPDTDPRDGRAYLRAIGGQFSMSYATISDLGFWSGRTGGLSLTGTDRPNTGIVSGSKAPTKSELNELTSGGVLAQSSGNLNTPDSRFATSELSYVSANIDHSTISGNTYGLFLSSATGVSITDTTVKNSAQDGLVLHRYVTNAVVQDTVSEDNGGNGFVLARASSYARITGSTAKGNGGDGFQVSGLALAHGPSASGETVTVYGSNSVSSSTARDNGHYGIEVIGGHDVGVQDNRVYGGDMGIVARKGTDQVEITGNRLTGQNRQGIAVRDGVTGATVTGNIVENTQTGVYVRDSASEVRGNTIQNAHDHGVSLVGGIGGSSVSYNVIAGVGPSAVDTARAHGGASVGNNQEFAWYDTSSFWIRFRHYASPMTLLWAFILVLILISAVLGHGRRSRRGGVHTDKHPYADKRALPGSSVTELLMAQDDQVAVMAE